MPQMEQCYLKVVENTEKWRKYEETQEDMQVYELKECAYKTKAINEISLEQANL